MALKVHLPFHNGTLENYGLTNIEITDTGIDLTLNGKIGKCATFSGTELKYLKSEFVIPASSTFSFASWVYLNSALNYVIVLKYDSYYLFSVSNNAISIRDNNTGSTGTIQLFNTTLPIAEWFHLAVTYNSGTIKVYVNGSLSGDDITCSGNQLNRITKCYLGGDEINASRMGNCKLNDTRIYTHCLSPVEVKKLSQGLVLHYLMTDNKFNTNLFSSFTVGARMTIDGNTIYSKYTGSDTYCYLNLSQSLVDGSTYTLSFDVWGLPNSSNWNFTLWNKGDYNITINRNGRIVFTFTLNTTSFTDSEKTRLDRILFDDWGKSGLTTDNTVYFSNFKLEEGSHSCSVISDGIEYDASGLKNNGTCTGITFSDDKPKYTGSCKFVNASTIEIPSLTSITNGTVCVWRKSSDSYWLLLGSNDSGGKYLGATQGEGKAFYHGGCGTILTYEDGERNTTGPNVDGNWHFYCFTGVNLSTWEVIYLNRYGRSTGSQFNTTDGCYSDFRIYATALSPDDIKELYNQHI